MDVSKKATSYSVARLTAERKGREGSRVVEKEEAKSAYTCSQTNLLNRDVLIGSICGNTIKMYIRKLIYNNDKCTHVIENRG
jgi:hypothetical protein